MTRSRDDARRAASRIAAVVVVSAVRERSFPCARGTISDGPWRMDVA